MNYTEVSNENGLSVQIVRTHEEDDKYEVLMGGDRRNLSWKNYFDEVKDHYKPHFELIKKSIIENGLVGETGQFADDLIFKFSDGFSLGFTWRGWGDLMSAIVDKNEGYMTYYM